MLAYSSVTVSNNDAVGVLVQGGASATLLNSSVSANGRNATALQVNGSDTQLTLIQADISSTGIGASGIRATDGAALGIYNSTVTLPGAAGANDDSFSSGAATTFSSLLPPSAAVIADGSRFHTINSDFVTINDNTPGLLALNGGRVGAYNSTFTTRGNNSHGILVSDLGTIVTLDKIRTTTTGQYADGIQVIDGGSVIMTGGSVSISGTGATGAHATGPGSKISGSGATISTSGSAYAGILVEQAAGVILSDSAVSATGDYTLGLLAHSGASASISHSSITTSGAYSATVAIGGATSRGILDNVQLSTTGYASGGIQIVDLDDEQPSGNTLSVSNSVISTTGEDAWGMLEFGHAWFDIHDSTFSTKGEKSHGIFVIGPGARGTLDNVQVTTAGSYANGVSMQGGGTLDMTGGSISVAGSGSIGAYVADSGSVLNISNATITAGGDASAAVTADMSAHLSLSGTIVSALNNNATGLRVQGGAYADIQGSAIVTSGTNTSALAVADFESQAVLDHTLLSTSGDSSIAIQLNAYPGNQLTTDNTLSIYNSFINTSGESAPGLIAYNQTRFDIHNSAFFTQGDNSPGIVAINPESQIVLDKVYVTTTGENAVGIILVGNGALDMAGGAITVSGAGSLGAIAVGSDAALNIADATITASDISAAGIFVTYMARASLSNSIVSASNDNATGLFIQDGGQMQVQGSSISTSGMNAHALAAMGNGISTAFTVDSSTIKTSGDYSAGILLSTDAAAATLTNTTITTTGSKAPAVSFVDAGAGTIHFSASSSTLMSEAGPVFALVDAAAEITLDKVTASTISGSLLDLSTSAPVTPPLARIAALPSSVNLTASNSLLTGDSIIAAGNSARIALNDRSTLTGAISSTGTTDLSLDNSNWVVTGNSSLTRLSNTGSTISFDNATGFKTLTVRDYTGNKGVIRLNTVFSGDTSQSDRLIIDGGPATGSTSLLINRTGGNGAQTGTGITLVQAINGGTTDQASFSLNPASGGYRSTTGTLAVGAYDYSLVRGGNGGNAQNWYLTSAIVPEPVKPIEPGEPSKPTVPAEPSVEPKPPVDPKPPVVTTPVPETPAAVPEKKAEPVTARNVRPEAGAYLATGAAARSMFMFGLHDREGYLQNLPGNQPATYAGWARITGSTGTGRAANGTLKLDTDTVTAQFGLDLFGLDNKYGSFRAGIMGGYGYADISSKARTSSLAKATGRVDGYSIGAYGTWYQNGRNNTGFYVDTWALYSWFDNEVHGYGLPREKFDSSSVTVSLEAGYGMELLRSAEWRVVFEPHVQVAYVNYSADSHWETGYATLMRFGNSNSFTTRAGARLSGTYDNGSGITIKPYLEANWWHNSRNDTVFLNTDAIRSNLPKNFAEVKLGVESAFHKNWQVWGEVSTRFGENHYSAIAGQVGVKYTW